MKVLSPMEIVQTGENNIDYDHQKNIHTIENAFATLSNLFRSGVPSSILDVGCGTGTWLRADADLGVADYLGIDGIVVADEVRHVPKSTIQQHDLSKSFNLNRRFDLILCLEVAEHLPESSSDNLISSLVTHSDTILFSAACPGQHGQHHINCQWPAYWQESFNRHGFTCDDSVRWQIWDEARIQPWYRQNIFRARHDNITAGHEPRIMAVIHPDMHRAMSEKLTQDAVQHAIQRIEAGAYPLRWYFTASTRAALTKVAKRILSKPFN